MLKLRAHPTPSCCGGAVNHELRQALLVAVRRAVASSTALETGQNIQQLEQKLQQPTQQRFAHIKLAA